MIPDSWSRDTPNILGPIRFTVHSLSITLTVHFYFVYIILLDMRIKGSLTDGYFMAAVTSWAKNKLVNHDRVLHFNDNKLADNGCFKFRSGLQEPRSPFKSGCSQSVELCISFFRNGKWNDIFVDRKIPVKLGQKSSLPKYAKWVNPHDKKAGLLAVHDFDWWCPLLEKAYAKINGGYDKIATGCAQAVLEGLTGGHALVTNANNLDCDRLADYCKNYLCTAGNEPHINCNANEFRIAFKIS